MTVTGGLLAPAAPDRPPAASRRLTLGLAGIAVAFFLLHLPSLVSAPDDVDTTNFLLGVRRFSIAEHRPHPPGYPVYISLGKISAALARRFAGGPDGALPIGVETRALAFWSALLGALAVFPVFRFFRALEGRAATAWWATLLVVCFPLYWFTANRALSDLAGLVVALLAQALMLDGLRRLQAGSAATGARRVVVGAFVTGLAGGVRAQAVWLALPVFVVVLLRLVRRRRLVVGALAASAAGFAAWAVPLVVSAGGPKAYVSALALQAYEDFSFVEMLWTHRELPAAMRALEHSFVLPFGTAWIAAPVLALAAAGLVVMLRRAPAAVFWLTAAIVPYAVAHLLFHETFTSRYPLPLLPAMAYLAVRGLDARGARWRAAGTIALAGLSLGVAIPAAADHARERSPAFRAVDELRATAERAGAPAAVAMHYSFQLMLRGEALPAPVLRTPPHVEWMSLARYWRDGGAAPVWLLANPRRIDLAMFDPHSVHLLRRFAWRHRIAAVGSLMDGSRPGHVDWYRLDRPAWMLGEGWSVNPQVRGVARIQGPEQGPVLAWTERRPGAAVLMIGGRHLDPESGVPVTLSVAVDGRPVIDWTVPASHDTFLRMIDLAPGDLDGEDGYAELAVTATAPADGPVPPIALGQFDLRDVGVVVHGFGRGWHELEFDEPTTRLWRWMSDRAEVAVRGARRDLVLRIAGDSPLGDHDIPPTIRVHAGERTLGRFSPIDDFTEAVRVPWRALDASGGVVTIESDRAFVPAERWGFPDRRRLSLRIRELSLR